MVETHISPNRSRPRVAVVKFASCDGCQLSILNLEDDLLALGTMIDIAYFPEASSNMQAGPYDITFVEGSITCPEDLPRILELRQQTTTLITIGACATSGGIQALRNWSDIEAFKQAVYPNPEYIQSLSTSTPISEHVSVDYELWGCPIDKQQLLQVLTDLLQGVRRVACNVLTHNGLRPDSMYVSLERHMECGIGLCGHCQLGPFFLCKDGPVMRLDRVMPFMGKVGV